MMKTTFLLAMLYTLQAHAVVLVRSKVVITNGACGTAHQVASITAPSANLCSAGNPSGVSLGVNQWRWSCYGLNGGATASCYAPKVTSIRVCYPGVKASCPIENGYGLKICDLDGSSWGNCHATACNTGYVLSLGKCVPSSMTSTTTTASGIPYDLTVNDPSNLLGTDRTLVLANFEAAINDWSGWIQSKGTLRIRMDVTGTTANGRFGGISGGSKYLAASSGHNIFEFSATYKMRTGLDADANVPDVIISVNAPFMRQYYWIDPSPSSRTLAVPAGKVDLVTVFAHELGHAFGMAGWLDLNSGAVPSNNGISQYDNLIYATSTLGEGKILFSGSKASAIYGKKVPVFFASQDNTSEQVIHNNATYLCNRSHTQNLFHYGYFMSSVPEYDSTFFGLMAGVWVNRSAVQGIRIRVGALDAAIMGDLGIPMKSSLASTALP